MSRLESVCLAEGLRQTRPLETFLFMLNNIGLSRWAGEFQVFPCKNALETQKRSAERILRGLLESVKGLCL
jgi:hypothetical protein